MENLQSTMLLVTQVLEDNITEAIDSGFEEEDLVDLCMANFKHVTDILISTKTEFDKITALHSLMIELSPSEE